MQSVIRNKMIEGAEATKPRSTKASNMEGSAKVRTMVNGAMATSSSLPFWRPSPPDPDPVELAQHQATARNVVPTRNGNSGQRSNGSAQLLQKPVERLVISSPGSASSIGIHTIDWIRAADNYVELHVGKTVHLLRQTLGSLERQLPSDYFFRISRSLIVNWHRVEELQTISHNDSVVLLHDGTRLSATRNYRENVQRLVEKSPLRQLGSCRAQWRSASG